MGTIRNIWVN